ncbi:MAG: gamma-glutamyltranspeptidase [Rhodospirillales bacterium]|nr:MAG: gamma-glutamyltranspeptidase [Rhodospirillales bacterium]
MSMEGSSPTLFRQCRPLILAALLAACDPGLAPGTIGHIQGFAGLAASDEPQSVLVARDILSAGGSAADAAVAMYFTMSVTLPSRVGIAGNGACVLHNPKTKTTEAIVFIPPSPAAVAAPRALFALHAKYGKLKWGALISPAESMARFGTPVSRALAQDLALAGNGLQNDPTLRAILAKADGSLAGEGDSIKNIELAAFMSRLRARGPADLYAGTLAREMSDAVQAAGGKLTPEDLRAVQVPILASEKVKFGNLTAHFAPAPSAAGPEQARLWKKMTEKAPAILASSGDAASGAGFMVADRDGQGVVCATSMGALFGSRKPIPSLGMILATGSVPQTSLGPMLVVAHNVHEFRYAMTSAGGEPGMAGLMGAAAKTLIDEIPLVDAVKAEAGKRVVAIGCSRGLPPHPDSCLVAVDPEGFGYGMGVGTKDK